MQAGKPGGLLEGMLRGRDHQKEHIAGAHPLKSLTDGDVTFDPRVQGASAHSASPQYESSDMGGSDDSTGKRPRCPDPSVQDVIWSIGVDRREPPCDPKTWWVRLDQQREINAWIRSREVHDALPQQASVLELGRTYNALFLHKIEASTKI